jgi:hypothetical protein
MTEWQGSQALRDLLASYAGRWQIDDDSDTHVWLAVRRPSSTSIEQHCARTPPELGDKLAEAEASEP